MVDVCIVMGVAITDAQNGEQHLAVKALKGFGGRILAVVDDLDGILIAPPCRRFAGVITILASRRRAGRRPSAKSIPLQ
ncbi:type II toxin-antitoxin system RelE/ParE family toxin [Mesorhizobium loti]|uniref:type II toxin-antitoxin system RelE/ParE family toxin n=1 Tax=Rhizobium loti TaxID=381 RepID=UPI001FE57AC3|nr:type II toxin-antitoxin system RelE/ParE family toxin [Mesorhizobium loti]